MSQKINNDILNFARVYCSIAHKDISTVYEMVLEARNLHKNGNIDNSNLILLNRWKDSLRTDFSIYDDPMYTIEAWISWELYSKQYIKKINSKISEIDKIIDLSTIKTFVDLGAGMGYSTVALTRVFPNVEMIATQLQDTWQWKFCEKLFNNTDIKLTTNSELESVDGFFASEYFEHFEKPMEHLKAILALEPKLLFIKNTFQKPDAVGHFEKYYDQNGNLVEGKYMNKIFNAYLRDNGYVQNPVRFFNSAPTVFIKEKYYKK